MRVAVGVAAMIGAVGLTPPAFADYLTLHSSGTLSSSYDFANVFGVGTGAGALEGQSYDLTLIFDPTVDADYQQDGGDPRDGEFGSFSYTGGPVNGYPYDAIATLVVAGKTLTLQGDSSTYSSYYPYRPLFALQDDDVDGKTLRLSFGYGSDDRFDIYGSSPGDQVAGGGFDSQDFSLTTTPGSFQGFPPASAVPEPSVWGLMLIGFGAIGGSFRRRRAPLDVAT
jgi:hypothetical protein